MRLNISRFGVKFRQFPETLTNCLLVPFKVVVISLFRDLVLIVFASENILSQSAGTKYLKQKEPNLQLKPFEIFEIM
jgi:hypothetical protein